MGIVRPVLGLILSTSICTKPFQLPMAEVTRCGLSDAKPLSCFAGPKGGGEDGKFYFASDYEDTMGSMKAFMETSLLFALTYTLTLGRKGIPEAAKSAVLNANYMMKSLEDLFQVAFPGRCMHEFVLTAEPLKKKTGVSAMDIAKSLLDHEMHPPTVYFPQIVHEALMIEPTDTESKQSIDEAVKVYRQLYEKACTDPEALHQAPKTVWCRLMRSRKRNRFCHN